MVSPSHALSDHDIKLGSLSILKSYFDLKKGMFWPIFALLGNFTRARFLMLIASV